MSADLEPDRFDRMLLGVADASPTRATYRAAGAVPPPHRYKGPAPGTPADTREPVITSTRGPRFVDKTACPMCGITDLGVEYHGELRDGTKVHQLAAHTAEKRSVQSGQPRCLGAGMRVAFVDGTWRGFVRVVQGGTP